MFSSDPNRPLARVIAAVAGLVIFGWGFHAIVWRSDLHYTNWFGELVFAPVAILLGIVIILGALLKPEILIRPPARKKR